MNPSRNETTPLLRKATDHSCLSCGTGLGSPRRRYCSTECRIRLRRQLELRTGLLKALNTRYATFFITKGVIVLDVLPYDTSEIYSFLFARSPDKTPAADFSRMADMLGNAWWAEKRRTNRKYLASRFVLEKARGSGSRTASVRPEVIRNPTVKGEFLVHLKLNRTVLDSPDLEKAIKSAYRKQAKVHHPDAGGKAAGFLKIQSAYEALIRWAENPTFTNRRGFPDKWFYDGYRNRWVQPTPVQRR